MGRRGNVKKKNVKAGDYTENFHINSQKKNITQIGHSQKKKKHHTSALRKEKTPFALDTGAPATFRSAFRILPRRGRSKP